MANATITITDDGPDQVKVMLAFDGNGIEDHSLAHHIAAAMLQGWMMEHKADLQEPHPYEETSDGHAYR
ncbi:hypothetical protein IGB42_02607 [Andreprevotia sp. IGB-42]|uniref:hypothetical protein n=1 Tax=Andreprevotia sp. IGB-42 TaxID=2497473 RepID=UPI00135C7257|nr:hypothetical protein [Andreprevotia sp. IGB-42]KAF0812764.1 hypothetical protein IGB42_02607 [Andreprevotia sp. IGB-42]